MTMNFLPVINIQHDFPEVISDLKSLDKSGTTKSVHGKVRVTSDTSIDNNNNDQNQNSSIVTYHWREGMESNVDGQIIQLIHGNSQLPNTLDPTHLSKLPNPSNQGVQTNGIECMDVAGDWIVTGGKNGKLRLDPNLFIKSSHPKALSSLTEIPEWRSNLTTSIDMTAKIYSINPDPSTPISSNTNETTKIMMNVRSLGPPHGRGVGGGGMIGKGKEIVTFCRDGKLRLWNLAESKVVIESDTWSSSTSSESDVLAMKVVEKGSWIERVPKRSDRQQSRNLMIKDDNDSSPIDAIAVSPFSDMVAYGTRSGRVRLITLNWRRSSSSSSSSCCSTSSSENMEIESLSVTIMASCRG
ncbi:hypothetical protein H4Q26_012474 [Puccinia striiformis f. sp. tritici PST-130]|nr:hypothetical protein H4Q26_012474 [Puccinia striiformis f. sp. tritici PST-130]